MLLCVLCYVFFFKQKTAYEMRISDWSSDVCSSDLRGVPPEPGPKRADRAGDDAQRGQTAGRRRGHRIAPPGFGSPMWRSLPPRVWRARREAASRCVGIGISEEHTSELQSLMRISYAVFCLKKKNKQRQYHYVTNIVT